MRLADMPAELRVLRGKPFTELTEKAFFDLCQLNEGWCFERSAQREIIVIPPVGCDVSESCGEISFQLWLWNRQAQLGHAFDSSAGFTLPDTSVRSPDVA